jgi:hypothetical protein
MVQKELRKFSQWFWKEFLKWYDGGGENRITSKRIFEVEVSFSSQNINSPFLRDFWSFSFSSSLFLALSLEDLGVLMIFEEKITSAIFSNGFNILAVGAYSGMELCVPTWLNHDYADGGGCGYIGGGRILHSGCMHTNVYGWG